MLGDIAEEDVVVLALFFGTEELEDAGVVAAAVERQEVAENLDGVGLENINLGHSGVFFGHWVLEVFP